ncbi:MAG: MltA domain-containing protein [Campylobacterales bacterium]
MRTYCLFLAGILALFLGGCAKKPAHVSVDGEAHSSGRFSYFEALPGWNEKKAESGLAVFRKQCAAQALPSREQLCASAMKATDAKRFFETHFRPFRLGPEAESGLMTGYYEPQLHGAMRKSSAYPYPIYATPSDLVRVELSHLYPDLAHRHLRGRVQGNRLVPYPSRAQINGGDITAEPICYVSSDIDRFFLHVQGSGRIMLDDNSTLFVGHTDRNGHPYRSIGKRMVEEGLIPKEAISLQSIRRYLKAHPQQKQRILESNPSYIFFGLRNRGATGTLGVELTPMHSVAIDRTKIPLGFPVYYDAQDPLTHRPMREVAMAQDTGSAIKGQVRADLFWGYGEKAEAGAGRMKSPLTLWLFVPAEAAPGLR